MFNLLDIFYTLLAGLFIYYGIKALWVSTLILNERSILRKITGGYYDFEIDDILAKMNLTRAEALEQFKDNK